MPMKRIQVFAIVCVLLCNLCWWEQTIDEWCGYLAVAFDVWLACLSPVTIECNFECKFAINRRWPMAGFGKQQVGTFLCSWLIRPVCRRSQEIAKRIFFSRKILSLALFASSTEASQSNATTQLLHDHHLVFDFFQKNEVFLGSWLTWIAVEVIPNNDYNWYFRLQRKRYK